MALHADAGKLPQPRQLEDIPSLVAAYFTESPDPANREQRIAFGTSGHRGSSKHGSFNEAHIAAITEAICRYRKDVGTTGPLFLGIDTHALSEPAQRTALEVLAAHGVETRIAAGTPYTPTPVISHAILTHNRSGSSALADGIVITPSHNPPSDGGFKYNPPTGGPAETEITAAIEKLANQFLENRLQDVRRIPYAAALAAGSTRTHDYLTPYVADLAAVVDFDAIRSAGLRLAVDPLGGAGVDYWGRIAETHRLGLDILNPAVDPTFRFMTLDWDGKIRMDPSSPYAMARLIGLKDKYDVAFACDTDHDRHGIVARSVGLLPSNHYLAVCIEYLFRHRPAWPATAAVGKTLVSSSMIDRLAKRLGRRLHEVPVGFKYFVEGLLAGSLGFVGEESAGASFLRRDGTVWTTDKDGMIAALLAAEMTARCSKDPGEIYAGLVREFGNPVYERIDAPATPDQKNALKKLSPEQVKATELAGEKIEAMLTRAPGDNQPVGGLKVVTANGWFAARPSGTENIYKIYAESFLGADHLRRLQSEAQALVASAISSPP